MIIKKGLLLINLGTPNSTKISDIKYFLQQFLMDKRVIDLPFLIRWLLVHGLIIPFRSKNTAHAYQSIWTEQGSPLMVHSHELLYKMQQRLDKKYKVVLGMRYGSPSIETALNELKSYQDITVLPLYPQYSSAATGSSIEEVMQVLAQKEAIPSLRVIRDFYQHPAFIASQVELINSHSDKKSHFLFSYHGLPNRQIIKGGCKTVCSEACPSGMQDNSACYRAQCFETTRLLAEKLELSTEQYTTAFQSRLGKTPWIRPYTDEVLPGLVQKGITHLVVACPSFTADCLETLEEIGLQLKRQWFGLGGKTFNLVPCLNSNETWIDAITQLIE